MNNGAGGIGTLAALLVFIVASVWLGTVAQRAVRNSSFLKGYFLGNRGLGAWTLALTATVQSGGTFMGFPALVYTHGWVVAMFICGYMVVPMTGFGVLGKRFAQLSRRTGAITVPDLFRERFASPAVGLTASLFILFFMSFMMVAQFKAGALVMKVAWPGSGVLALSEEAAAYTLDDSAIAELSTGVPSQVVVRLAPLSGRSFDSADALEAELAGVLSADELSSHRAAIESAAAPIDWLYYLGLAIFAATVVGYTLIGGFLAAVWTDLFQSVMMLIGIVILLPLSLYAVGGLDVATQKAAANTSAAFLTAPGHADPGWQFMPIGLGFSFFFVWVFSGMGSPAGVVRIMASKDTATIKKSIFLLSAYNMFIYIPLILICICGRALMPDLKVADEVIPRMALTTTKFPGGSLVAGLILTAPFGAVMATVSSYLVVIASGLVRDVYQRFINPDVSAQGMRRLTYMAMVVVGAIAVAANLNPVQFLQAVVIFSGTSAAATFVIPSLMAAYWRRATAAGALAAMICGATTTIGLYVFGWTRLTLADWLGWTIADQAMGQKTRFKPYYLAELDPIVWGLLASLVAGIAVSLLTRPPANDHVAKLFDTPTS